jgi:ArsR family transcriptional regulator
LLTGGEQCACVLLADMDISQPTLSHHMKILCDSGIVKSRRVGKWNYYAIDTDGCAHASRLLDAIAKRDMKRALHILRVVSRCLHPVKTLRKYVASSRAASALSLSVPEPAGACCLPRGDDRAYTE